MKGLLGLLFLVATLTCPEPAAAATGLGLTRMRMDAIKVLVATAGALVLVWEARRRRAAEPTGTRQRRLQILIVVGLFAGLCWWDLFQFHFRSYVHVWEFQHYYIAAKYFPELGYSRLYVCMTVADAEDGVLQDGRNELVRDLSTNGYIRKDVILSEPELCTRHFSQARWRMFKHDLAWFRGLIHPKVWARAQRDFGYNGSPAWLVLGNLLAHTGPASSTQIWLLSLIDPALLIGMWAFTWWTFGGPATAVALLWWGTNSPAFFGWTGGAYLRQDWLVALVVGIGLLYRRRWIWAGFALTFAAALRVFPVVALGALGISALLRMWTERRLSLPREYRQLLAGCAVAVALIAPASILVAEDWRAWPEFVWDIRKHSGAFVANLTGLKALVAYDGDTRVAKTAALEVAQDPFQVWLNFRDRIVAERRLIHVGLAVTLSLVVLAAIRHQPEWVVAVVGLGLTPILTSISSYYYSFLLVFGLVGWWRPAIGIALCLLAVLTQAVPLLFSYFDDRYTATSVLILAFIGFASVALARRPLRTMPDPCDRGARAVSPSHPETATPMMKGV